MIAISLLWMRHQAIQLYKWSLRYPNRAISLYLVLALHIFVLCYLGTQNMPSVLVAKGKINVKTTVLKAVSAPVVLAKAPVKKAKPKPVPVAATAPKPKPIEKPVATKTPAKKEVIPPPPRQADIHLLENALASLDAAPSPPQTSRLQSIKSIEKLGELSNVAASSRQGLTEDELAYCDELMSHLKLHLSLPDYGEVTVKLTLSRQGTVLRVKTISSENQKNRSYIEEKLPSVHFPSFRQHFANESSHEFLIILCNEHG
jgi:outer membrane biosynthesis protein TonB